jgi:1-acyl-sn-glycerol-3-phosphate acyltransferase
LAAVNSTIYSRIAVWTWILIQLPLLSILTIVISLMAMILIPCPLKYRYRLIGHCWKFWSHYLMKILARANVQLSGAALDSLKPLYREGGLVICNHQSMWDIPLVLSAAQVPPVMKKELLRIPFFGAMAKFSGALPLDRSSQQSRKAITVQIKERLASQIPILLFPEGTRHQGPFPRSFEEIKVASLHAAFLAQQKVYPIRIEGTRALASGLRQGRLGQVLRLRLSRAIDPKDFSEVEDFARACWSEVCSPL